MRIRLLSIALLCFMSLSSVGSKNVRATDLMATAGSAMDPVTAVANIAPTFAPLLQQAYDNYVLAFKTVFNGLSKKSLYCNNVCNRGPACKIGVTFRGCKDSCQQVQQIGGYTLRVRFGQDWNLTSCLNKAIESKLQTSAGRGDLKSIAIYSEADYLYVLKLLSNKETAETVLNSGGNELNLKGAQLKKALDELKKAVSTIDANIQNQVKSGRFGNQ